MTDKELVIAVLDALFVPHEGGPFRPRCDCPSKPYLQGYNDAAHDLRQKKRWVAKQFGVDYQPDHSRCESCKTDQ